MKPTNLQSNTAQAIHLEDLKNKTSFYRLPQSLISRNWLNKMSD
jgi:hypothetical protein